MFCGECGKSVTVPSAAAARAPLVEITFEDVGKPEIVAEPEPEPQVIAEPEPEPEHEVDAEPEPEPEPDRELEAIAEPQPDPSPPFDDPVDLEATRITSATPVGERFVLQFSTGESVTVFGTGIIGRNPVAEPGEYFDHSVTIIDPGKSVSKTHLEFGQVSGAFWINDRYSANGTGIRQPESPRVSCEPGKRYLVARGSRVDIGDQFFIVS
jgi:pSer/pThr/pTyr-binding forkhead associated (FHA) protein